MTRKTKHGFTMIELLVVIAIIGVLAAIILVSLAQARTKSRNSAVTQAIVQYINAIALYSTNNDNLIPTLTTNYPVCLGQYPSGCGYNNATANSTGATGLITKLTPFISPSPINATMTTASGAFTGAVYQCFNYSASSNPTYTEASGTCSGSQTIGLLWYQDGAGQKCARGGIADTIGSATRCVYPLGFGNGTSGGQGYQNPVN